MALLGTDFRGRARLDEREVDVVDDDLGIVLLAPVLRVLGVEPFVVTRDEVAPLQDLERLGGARRRRVEEWTNARRNACGTCRPDDVAAGQPATTGLPDLHGFPPLL